MARKKPAGAAAGDVLLDTGVLVALHNRSDPLHQRAVGWLSGFAGQLHSVEPVLSEAAFFLPALLRASLADLASLGTIRLHHPDAQGLARIGQVLRKYEDIDPDWADATLVWLAEHTGIRHIATIDVADFGVYRLHGRTRFELVLL